MLFDSDPTDKAAGNKEILFRGLLEAAPDGIIIVDRHHNILLVNKQCERLFGYSRVELLGKPIEMLVPERFASSHLRLSREYFQDPRTRPMGADIELLGRRKDGSEFPAEISLSPLETDSGMIVSAAVRDVSIRRQELHELESTRRLLAVAIENSPAGIVVADAPDGNIRIANPAALAMRGKTSVPLTGIPIELYPQNWQVYYPDGSLYEPEDLPLARAILKGETSREVEIILHSAEGQNRWVSANAAPLRNEQGQITGAIDVFSDITDRKNAEETLRKTLEGLEEKVRERTADLQQANEKLKEIDRLKSMFIASMSHELRTPLNAIIGFSSILFDEWVGPLNAEQKENLATVVRSGKHLLALINDVIDVSKVEAGQLDIHIDRFDLYEVLEEAVTTLKGQAESQNLRLKLSNLHHQLTSDRLRLLQVVLNLLSNAIKYTKVGTVSLAAQVLDNGMVEISVSDTGVGISAEDQPRLFKPFVRLDSALNGNRPGTGLGLYLCQKLVSNVLQGDLSVTSREGKGSRFVLTLPERGRGR